MPIYVICFVDGGNVIGARSDSEEVIVGIWDNDNIEAGDPEPFPREEIEERHPVAVVLVDWVEERRRRQQLTEDHGELYGLMKQLFFWMDPVGINLGTNQDEYAAEVSTVLPRLRDATSAGDVLQILNEEFDRWFGPTTYRDDLTSLAERTWDLWQAHGQKNISKE